MRANERIINEKRSHIRSQGEEDKRRSLEIKDILTSRGKVRSESTIHRLVDTRARFEDRLRDISQLGAVVTENLSLLSWFGARKIKPGKHGMTDLKKLGGIKEATEYQRKSLSTDIDLIDQLLGDAGHYH